MILVLLFGGVLAVNGDQNDPYPKVALKCGRDSHYFDLSANEWRQDLKDFSSCMNNEDPLNVLRYCRYAYPKLDIRSVSENTAKDFIPGFCDEKSSPEQLASCPGRQFTCRTANFKPRVLEPPVGCMFSHNAAEPCKSAPELQAVAERECSSLSTKSESFHLYDYAVLPPSCEDKGTPDKFSGVEYVCCPLETLKSKIKKNEDSLKMLLMQQSTICRLPPESGNCEASVPKWYYDARQGTCFEFFYGGCSGNANRFDDNQTCMDTCKDFGFYTEKGGNAGAHIQDSVKKPDSSAEEQKTQSIDEDKELLQINAGSGWKIDEEPQEISASSNPSPTSIEPAQVDFDLSVLMGGEPAQWFKVKIADIDYLKDDFNHESLKSYKQALIELEDSYEEQMTKLMHAYERAEKSFVQAVQSSNSNIQLAEAFQKQVVQLYESAIRGLETQYRDMKAQITQTHRARVSYHRIEKLEVALDAVNALLYQPKEYVQEPELLSLVTKYLDLQQDAMKDDIKHYRRLATLSYARASQEHRVIMDAAFAAHEDGMSLCQKVMDLEYLTYSFRSQMDVVMSEFDEYFSNCLGELDQITQSITPEFFGFKTTGSAQDKSATSEKPEVQFEQSGVFAAMYSDPLPGIKKKETLFDSSSHSGSEGKIILGCFGAILFVTIVLLVGVWAIRKRRIPSGANFLRVDNNPHPLSPEEKHINSLQVNGYYNPIYKFFDEPQEST